MMSATTLWKAGGCQSKRMEKKRKNVYVKMVCVCYFPCDVEVTEDTWVTPLCCHSKEVVTRPRYRSAVEEVEVEGCTLCVKGTTQNEKWNTAEVAFSTRKPLTCDQPIFTLNDIFFSRHRLVLNRCLQWYRKITRHLVHQQSHFYFRWGFSHVSSQNDSLSWLRRHIESRPPFTAVKLAIFKCPAVLLNFLWLGRWSICHISIKLAVCLRLHLPECISSWAQ